MGLIRGLYEKVKPGGWLVWLDTQLPMYRKDQWTNVAQIGLVRSTNHRVRLVSIFQRTGGGECAKQ